jgi:hypothetical protein
MKRSWFWLLSLLLIVPHLAVAQPLTITQVDSFGNPTTSTRPPLTLPLSISPDFLSEVDAGQTEVFEASGGSGEYTWQVARGSLSSTEGKIVMYTAPSCEESCQDFVTVSDADSGDTEVAEIYIQPKEESDNPLLITPEAVNLAPGGVQDFQITNAEGPINWTTTDGNIVDKGTIGNAKVASYTAPDIVGVYEVSATEIYNPSRVATATITVDDIAHITPENVVLPPGGQQQFRLSGVNDNIRWTTTGGYVEDGDYTAPEELGSYEVNAYYDDADNYETAYIEVIDQPVITPKKSVVGIGGEATFEVTGGEPPYRWTATDNSCSIIEQNDDQSVVTYRCSQAGNVTTITVTDNFGQESQSKATIEVSSILTATRNNVYITQFQTETVGVTGGIPPYNWNTNNGGNLNDLFPKKLGEKIYSAPNVLGNDVITITDSANASVNINVYILEPLSVTPQVVYMKPDETTTEISVVGGMPPYKATASQGSINQSDFSFTSGSEEDDITITICDQILEDDGGPRCEEVTVHVRRNDLKLVNLPEQVTIETEYPIQIAGGTGGYFVSPVLGKISNLDPETGVATYIAPNSIGEDTITITDKSGNTLEYTIEVVGYILPVIQPASIYLAPGETYTFSASRGVPPYVWSFNGGVHEDGFNEDNTLVKITAPQTTITYTLSVTDTREKQLVNATINVFQPLKLTPDSPKVYKGEFAKVRINKLGGVGKCNWSSDTLSLSADKDSPGTILDTAPEYIIVKPRTDVDFGTQYKVTCHDQNNDEAHSTITVSQLQNDQNSDGLIDAEEAETSIEQFFAGEAGMNKTMLYLHLELFMMSITQ